MVLPNRDSPNCERSRRRLADADPGARLLSNVSDSLRKFTLASYADPAVLPDRASKC